MIVYCTSKNSGPSWQSDPVTMVYLGTSIVEALKAVGRFARYQKSEDNFPAKEHIYLYSSLPRDIEFKLVNYYMADGWWYSVVSFELNE
jgi:hypothetical protein